MGIKDTESLLDALTKPLSAALVKELDEKVEALRGEITERENKIESLLQLKKIDDIRKNGKPARKAKGEGKGKKGEGRGEANGGGAATSPNSAGRDDVIHAFLLKAGPTKSMDIARACGIPTGSITIQMQRLLQQKRIVSVAEGWKAI